jgi:hypothetical protein
MQKAEIKATAEGTDADHSTAYDSFDDRKPISRTGKTTALPEDHYPKILGRKAAEFHRCEADHILYGYLSGKLP